MKRSGGDERFTAVLELDDSGGWSARVAEVPGICASGACLSEVRRRLRAELVDRVGADATIQEQIQVDTDLQRRVDEVQGARDRFEQARSGLRRQMVRAAAVLRDRGLSSRDAGALLGVSQQRVSQLWQEDEEAPT